MRAVPSSAAVLCVLLLAQLATAQSSRAPIRASGCSPELLSAVEPALDVELTNASSEARLALERGVLQSELVCEGEVITAVVDRGGERVEQRVPVDGPALPRRLAMVLTELVEASASPEVAPPPHPIEPAVPTADPLRVRVRLAGGVWAGGAPVVALGALEAGVELAPTPNVAMTVSLAGALGATSVPNARLDVRLLSLAASARFGGWLDSFWLGAGPAARGGAVFWAGTPSDPTLGVPGELVGAWLGLGAVAAGFVRLPEIPVRVGVEVEGGGIAVYSGALVLGVLAQQIGGGWVEARLAVDVAVN